MFFNLESTPGGDNGNLPSHVVNSWEKDQARSLDTCLCGNGLGLSLPEAEGADQERRLKLERKELFKRTGPVVLPSAQCEGDVTGDTMAAFTLQESAMATKMD